MELWDIYDEDRIRTGRTIARGMRMRPGDYHLIVHMAIINKDGLMLIQQRQMNKTGWPGKWDLSVGGGAVSGENSRQAAQRELEEELGIKLDFRNRRPALTINFDGGFDDIYVIRGEYACTDLCLQESEVQAVKWAYAEEILEMIDGGQFVPYPKSYIRLIFDTAIRPVYL